MEFYSSKWTHAALGLLLAVGFLPGKASGVPPGALCPVPPSLNPGVIVAPFQVNGSVNNLGMNNPGIHGNNTQLRISGKFVPPPAFVGITIPMLKECSVVMNWTLCDVTPVPFIELIGSGMTLFPKKPSKEKIRFETPSRERPTFQLEIESRANPVPGGGRPLLPGVPPEFRLKVDKAANTVGATPTLPGVCPVGFVHKIPQNSALLDTDFTIMCPSFGNLTVSTTLLLPPAEPPCWKEIPPTIGPLLNKLRTPY